MDFDAIVIGSGFGGAISGCRLAEAGCRVLILERGRRWDPAHYPRDPEDAWNWSHERPERENGWVDLRLFSHMAVAQGAGVGGGSLIYANVSAEPPPDTFKPLPGLADWPPEITGAELEPYFRRVKEFMNVQRLPEGQWTARTRLVKEAAEKIGQADRFKLLELAVSFDPDLHVDPDKPSAAIPSKSFHNAQGVEQGTCVHCGGCDIGCPYKAKNTLDLNYIPWAEKHGAEVRPLHLVSNIEPVNGGYRVYYDRLEDGQRRAGSATGSLVIVAAGSLGSTELLLRCRDETRSLPALSPFLGHNWSSNGDFLTPAIYERLLVEPSFGPTISSAIDFLDGSDRGRRFWIQDGGVPDLLALYLKRRAQGTVRGLRARLLVDAVRGLLELEKPFQHVMPWFAQGVDEGNGLLRLRRRWWLWGPRELDLDWDVTQSRPTFDAIVDMHRLLSDKTGGVPLVPPTWYLAHDLITPHPLGGCNMGRTPTEGVVDHTGEVFGYPNLYVADGAIIPRALGVNPSRTIGALAERTAKLIVEKSSMAAGNRG
jgi:cholesterol oxidase